jgi:predicted Zn-dependent peptidase
MNNTYAPHIMKSLRSISEVRKTTLSNGIRIITEHVPGVHSLAVGIWIDAGSRDETPEDSGMCHFIEHMVFKGTARRRTHHIAQYLEAVGGYLNAYTSKDSTCYYARVLQPHLGRAVHLLADIVLNASFRETDIEKEKQVIIEEMRGADDDAEDAIHDRFEELLYRGHTLAQPVIGREESVRSFTRERILQFVGTHYVARNMIVAAAGAVDHEELVRICEQELADAAQGPSDRRRKPRRSRGGLAEFTRPVQQSHMVIGSSAQGYAQDVSMALQVFSALLGEGMSSRLFQRIRERHGFTYNVYSFVHSYVDVSSLGMYLAVERGKERKARQLALREVESLASRPVSTRELNRAREQVLGGMLLALESMNSRMTRLGRDELACNRDVPLAEVLDAMRGISPDTMQELAASLLEQPVSVLFLPDS